MNDNEKAPHMPVFKFVRKILNGIPPSSNLIKLVILEDSIQIHFNGII
jgi:hypothetical protein